MGHKSRHDPDIFQHGWLWSPTKWQPVQPTTAISLLRVKLEPLSYGTGPSWDFMCAWLECSQVKSRRKLHKVTSSNVLRVPAIIQKRRQMSMGKRWWPLGLMIELLACCYQMFFCLFLVYSKSNFSFLFQMKKRDTRSKVLDSNPSSQSNPTLLNWFTNRLWVTKILKVESSTQVGLAVGTN